MLTKNMIQGFIPYSQQSTSGAFANLKHNFIHNPTMGLVARLENKNDEHYKDYYIFAIPTVNGKSLNVFTAWGKIDCAHSFLMVSEEDAIDKFHDKRSKGYNADFIGYAEAIQLIYSMLSICPKAIRTSPRFIALKQSWDVIQNRAGFVGLTDAEEKIVSML